jgi:hypothetical protein
MPNARTSEIIISPRGLPPEVFNSGAEVERWASAEVQIWETVSAVRPGLRRAYKAAQSNLQAMQRSFRGIQNAAASGDATTLNAVIADQQSSLVPSTSPPGQLILETAKLDPEIARMMLALQRGDMGSHLDFTRDPPPWDLVTSAIMRMSPIFLADEKGEFHSRSFAATTELWTSRLQELHDEQKSALEIFNASSAQTLSDIEAIAKDNLQNLNSASSDALTGFQQATADRKGTLDNLINAYNEHLRLQAPATYWTEKAQAHKNSRKNLRWSLLGTLAAFIVLTIISLKWLDPFLSKNAVHSLILVSPAVLVGLWSARLLFRGYNRNNDLLHDAEQRAVLATTYLALTKEGAAQANEAERLLILQALVRADTISPDDVSASALVELAKVAVQGPHR